METHLAHRGETWALAVSPAQDTVVTAGPDGELKFWTATLPVTSDMEVDEMSKFLTTRINIKSQPRSTLVIKISSFSRISRCTCLKSEYRSISNKVSRGNQETALTKTEAEIIKEGHYK